MREGEREKKERERERSILKKKWLDNSRKRQTHRQLNKERVFEKLLLTDIKICKELDIIQEI